MMQIRVAAAILLALAAGFMLNCFSLPQGMEHHHMDGMDMQSVPGPTAAQAAKLEADKRFSEFNHRFAGLFVLLAGLLTLAEPYIARRWDAVRYLWAVFFFIPGLYLLFMSDPESWPVGQQTLRYVITSNREVLQHKIFSAILMVLGIVEFQRVKKKLRSWWAVGLFPLLAASGAVLLLFHAHPGGAVMDQAAHASMQKIEHQHAEFALTGFGIAVSKGAVDLGRPNTRLMRGVFALLMATLGILLLRYTE